MQDLKYNMRQYGNTMAVKRLNDPSFKSGIRSNARRKKRASLLDLLSFFSRQEEKDTDESRGNISGFTPLRTSNLNTMTHPQTAKPVRKTGLIFSVILGLLLIAAIAVACATPGFAQSFSPKSAMSLAGIPANATPTPTPFLPMMAQEVVEATQPPAADQPVIQGSEPQSTAPVREEHISFMLLGSDQRPNENGFRTDAIMLVIVNKDTNAVSIISLPRDLYVTIPGWGEDRINTVFPSGGFDLLADTMEYNFGIRPDHYALTYFWSFVETVDSLGGLDVPVPEALYDQCELPQMGYCAVEPGIVHMDGQMALWYVRSRRTTSDFSRSERQQLIVSVLFDKLMSMDAVSRIPELYNIFAKNVETDIAVDDVMRLIPVASKVFTDHNNLKSFAIGPYETIPTTTYYGASVLLPDYDAISLILQEALSR